MTYRHIYAAVSTVIAVAALALAPVGMAQDQDAGAKATAETPASEDAYSDKVVAKVDGKPITEAQLRLARDELGSDLAQLPEEAQRKLVLQYVVELNLLAKAAHAAGLDQTQDYKQLARYYELRALRDIFFQREIRDNITDEAAKKLYDERIGSAEPEEEVRARHILVKTEDEAKAIIKQLADGADFAELAKEESTGPSGSNGGDLGFFTKGQMVGPFADAAFALKKGEVSQPVKSRFGWHVIKVENKRDRQPPEFAELKDRLKGSLIRQRLQTRMAELRGAANVEILDESLKKDEKPADAAPDADSGQQAQ